jgi:hypothetical protein
MLMLRRVFGFLAIATITPRQYSAMSPTGTFRTFSHVRLESASKGKADYMCSDRVFPGWTHNRHHAKSNSTLGC